MNELPFDLKAPAFQAAVQAAERVAQSSITTPQDAATNVAQAARMAARELGFRFPDPDPGAEEGGADVDDPESPTDSGLLVIRIGHV